MYTDRYIVFITGWDICGSATLSTREWRRSGYGTTFCRECGALDRSLYPEPVNVYLHQVPKGASYDTVAYLSIGVIHRSLYEELEPHLGRFVLGKCYGKDGSLLEDYHSIYGKDYIRRRGDETADDYYTCKVCGLTRSALAERYYVLREELADHTVYQDVTCSLYLSAAVAPTLKWKRYRDLKPVQIEVLDEPLPGDPFPGST